MSGWADKLGVALIGLGIVLCSGAASTEMVPAPQKFRQEVATNYAAAQGLPPQAVQLIDLDPARPPVALAGGRWYELTDGNWKPSETLTASQTHCGVSVADQKPIRVPLAAERVLQVLRLGATVWVVADDAIQRISGGETQPLTLPPGARVHQLAAQVGGVLWLATDRGLFRQHPGASQWERSEIKDHAGRDLSALPVLGVAVDARQQVWIAQTVGVARRTTEGWECFDAASLPWNEFTGVAAGPDGDVWFTTRLGVIRWHNGEFHYRQGPRWLPGDEVRSASVAPDGTAWFATAGGVGCLGSRDLTLAQKAEWFEAEIAAHLARTPFGYVAEAPLRVAGDKSSAVPEDSDNDGLWTAMYGAGECFAFAATGDSAAKQRAKRVFEALRFLQTVTQGGSNAPAKGFVARTIRPTQDPDPNIGRSAADRAEQQEDRLWKVIEPRWPRSADGEWFWKSDTSSDELDGHFFFYPLYYDFCADTETEKARVREVVRDLTEHLLAHDFTLTDHDGRPTRWAVFGPEALNRSADWWPERGLNSLSLLSYLAVAAHVTGEAKYLKVFDELVARHGYLQNAMEPKVQHGPGSGNQSDDEMAFMCFYNLLRYAPSEAVKARVRLSLFRYGANEFPERNPLFNFIWAAVSREATAPTVWGEVPVGPWTGWQEEALTTLRGFPLDRLDWPARNSHRLDLQFLTAQANFDAGNGAQRRRGGLRDGRVLPIENRHVSQWNTDPWRLDYGGAGRTLAPGTAFLLPYYLGLYHGFIAKPD